MYQREKDLGHKHHGLTGGQRLTAVLERLVQLYDAWGKPTEAARWRKQLEKTKEKP
jgi:molybdenum-dependent DNA-binding transcriptional regulator ModE